MCPNSVGHDECLVGPQSALLVEADSSTFLANTYATESGSDPGFCCRSDAPGSTGFGTVWFKFTATDTSAKISTCNNDPAKDSMFQVFAAGDSSTEERGCATLAMIACSDDVDDCGGGRHGKICVRNLTPGLTYYVMVAAKTSETKGVYQLDIRSPCFDEPIWIADDCNGDGLSDGCEIARGVGADCNLNLILDECEIADGTSLDCNGDSIPDECTSALRVFSPDSPSYSFGAAGAVDGDWVLIGNPYGIGDPDPRAGAAYLFHRTMLTWDKVARLEVPETGRRYFGNSVAMANDEAFVQDFANDEEGMTGVAGAVYVFGHDGADWRFQTKLVVDDPSEWSRTLCQVSVDGDYAAVSACFLGGWFGVPVPAVVYIFHRGSTGWNQEGKLTLPGSVTLGDYAWTIPISLNKNRLAIGAPWESFDDAFQPGAVYVYKRDATGWALESRLTAPDAYMHRNFGAALDLRGDRLVAAVGGAPVSPPMPGAPEMAFQFRRVGSVWGLDGSLSDASAYHSLLDSVAFINDGMTLVGAAGGPHGADFAYVFQRLSTGVWGKVATLGAPAQFSSSTVNYPTVVRAGRDFAIVGVWNPEPSNVEPHGSAYLFAISGGDCNQNGVTDGCDIRDRTSADCDHNGVPDECETLPPFDYDFDGDVDLIDLAGFQRCFTGPATVALCCRMFDSDPDGDVDGDDFVAFGRAFTGP